MYKIPLLILSVSFFACGSGDGSGGGDAAIDPSSGAKVYANLVDVPTCEEALEGALVYIQEKSGFQFCKAGTWTDIDLKGPAGKDGESIVGEKGDKGDKGDDGESVTGQKGDDGTALVSLTNLNSNGNDLCTRYSNEMCHFRGGTVKRYSNGLVEFQARLYRYFSYDDAGDFDSDSYFVSSNPVVAAPDDVWMANAIVTIQRTGSDDFKGLWLVYTIATDSFRLVFDVNGNGTYEPEIDEVIETLTETSVYLDD